MDRTKAEVEADVLTDIYTELRRAEQIHPRLPDDNLRRAGIVCEESGEVMKAAMDATRQPKDSFNQLIEEHVDLYNETLHVAAASIRNLIAMKPELEKLIRAGELQS
jgi:hypothetical protein